MGLTSLTSRGKKKNIGLKNISKWKNKEGKCSYRDFCILDVAAFLPSKYQYSILCKLEKKNIICLGILLKYWKFNSSSLKGILSVRRQIYGHVLRILSLKLFLKVSKSTAIKKTAIGSFEEGALTVDLIQGFFRKLCYLLILCDPFSLLPPSSLLLICLPGMKV